MRWILLLLLSCAPVIASAQTNDPRTLWLEANNAYQSGEYAKAAAAYQRLVDAGVTSSDVYFNLGTAELRAGRRGAAILSLERALRVDPADGDAAYNLSEAQKGNVDRIVGTREEEPLLERLGARIPVDVFGPLFVATWLVCWLALLGRMFVSKGRGALGWAAGVAGLIAVVSGASLGLAAWQRKVSSFAVVVAAESAIREGPARNFKAAFDVHEGLKLRVIQREQEFLRVRLPNGIEGWISEKDAPLI